MASIEANLETWNQYYEWPEAGDEWSQSWGGPRAQWWGALFPRIHSFLPTGTILEIAPGYGRWTQFLRTFCQRLVAVDLSPRCIEACKSRFAEFSNLEYHVNDGRSLEMVRDGSIDFAFSFDSLVHVDDDVLEAYLRQLAGKLTPDGVGFIHHSNVHSYLKPWEEKLPGFARERAIRTINARINKHWRSPKMSAARFGEICESAGLECITQEVVPWGSKHLIDCFSTFTRQGSSWARPVRRLVNAGFMEEAARIREMACSGRQDRKAPRTAAA